MLPFHVRPSQEEDLDAITRIYTYHVRHSTSTFELDPPTREEMLQRRETILSRGLPYLVAEENGAVIGYAYAGIYRPRPAYRFTVEDSIYLAPSHTGRGCGRQLLESLIAHCGQGPWHQMVAVIGDSANTPSIRLHERFGFRRVGTLENVGYKFDKWLDTVLMQRALGDDSQPD